MQASGLEQSRRSFNELIILLLIFLWDVSNQERDDFFTSQQILAIVIDAVCGRNWPDV